MDRRQIGTKLVLDALGEEFTLERFPQRLILQKVIYLAQAVGIHLGYHYGWYVRGPYSRGLTSDAFSLKEELNGGMDETKEWTLDQQSQNLIPKLKGLMELPDCIADRPQWLELLASVHFLVGSNQINVAQDHALMVQRKLANYEKDFTLPQVSEALTRLRGAGLLNQG